MGNVCNKMCNASLTSDGPDINNPKDIDKILKTQSLQLIESYEITTDGNGKISVIAETVYGD